VEDGKEIEFCNERGRKQRWLKTCSKHNGHIVATAANNGRVGRLQMRNGQNLSVGNGVDVVGFGPC